MTIIKRIAEEIEEKIEKASAGKILDHLFYFVAVIPK